MRSHAQYKPEERGRMSMPFHFELLSQVTGFQILFLVPIKGTISLVGVMKERAIEVTGWPLQHHSRKAIVNNERCPEYLTILAEGLTPIQYGFASLQNQLCCSKHRRTAEDPCLCHLQRRNTFRGLSSVGS
jgi:hypothetical protein